MTVNLPFETLGRDVFASSSLVGIVFENIYQENQ